jgi:hypothetical protein
MLIGDAIRTGKALQDLDLQLLEEGRHLFDGTIDHLQGRGIA